MADANLATEQLAERLCKGAGLERPDLLAQAFQRAWIDHVRAQQTEQMRVTEIVGDVDAAETTIRVKEIIGDKGSVLRIPRTGENVVVQSVEGDEETSVVWVRVRRGFQSVAYAAVNHDPIFHVGYLGDEVVHETAQPEGETA